MKQSTVCNANSAFFLKCGKVQKFKFFAVICKLKFVQPVKMSGGVVFFSVPARYYFCGGAAENDALFAMKDIISVRFAAENKRFNLPGKVFFVLGGLARKAVYGFCRSAALHLN